MTGDKSEQHPRDDRVVQGAHDPGGKTRLAMIPGVVGNAEFSPCGCYRHWLSRNWDWRLKTDGRCGPWALWIGMNPSTAEADVDDPTIRREMAFSKAMMIDVYVKVNVMDYRATDPKRLRDVTPRSDRNLQFIKELADGAGKIICAWGALPKPLRRYADDVLTLLHDKPLYCMGRTADGSPRHPLYLPGNASVEIYRNPSTPGSR